MPDVFTVFLNKDDDDDDDDAHPKLLHSKFKEICSKPGGVDHPPCF